MSLPDPITEPAPLPTAPSSPDVTIETILLAVLKQRWSLQISMALVPRTDGPGMRSQYTIRALSPEGKNRTFPMHNYQVMSIAATLPEAIAAIPQKIVEVLRQ